MFRGCWQSFSSPFLAGRPSLTISGPEQELGIDVLRLLSCVCRHPLMLAEVTPGGSVRKSDWFFGRFRLPLSRGRGVSKGPMNSGPFLFVQNPPREARQTSTLPMRKVSKPKQKRGTPRSPRREKRASSAVRIENPCPAAAKCIATAGQRFPNATIDLVADASDSYRLNLLHWDGSSATVAPRIEYGRATYEPIAPEPSLVNAVQWPKSPLEYGSTMDLFGNVLGLITRHAEI